MPSSIGTNATPGPERDRAFDVALLVAALAVIIVHSPGLDRVPDWSLPLRFAVPFFCCTAVHFAFVRFKKDGRALPLREYVEDRFERVYRPFISWSLIYALVQLGAFWAGIADNEPALGPHLFLLGGAAHLWFIPFILVAGVLAYGAMPIVSRHPIAASCMAAMAALGLSAWQAWMDGRPEDLPLPVQLVARSTSIFAALAIVSMTVGIGARTHLRRTVGVIGAGFVVVGSWLAVSEGGSRVMWGTAIGVAAYCACLGAWRWRWMDAIGWLGPYSLGVYFAHYAFIEGYEDIARKLLGVRINPFSNAVLVLASVASAILVVWVLARSKSTRFLVR